MGSESDEATEVLRPVLDLGELTKLTLSGHKGRHAVPAKTVPEGYSP